MFSFGRFSEILIIASIALVLFKPEDLQSILRKLGQLVSSMRRISSEIRESLDKDFRDGEFEDYVQNLNKKVLKGLTSSTSLKDRSSILGYQDNNQTHEET